MCSEENTFLDLFSQQSSLFFCFEVGRSNALGWALDSKKPSRTNISDTNMYIYIYIEREREINKCKYKWRKTEMSAK